MTATDTVPRETGVNRRLGLFFASLMVTMLLAALNQTVLSTALPTIVGDLHGVDQMTWVITSYILASTIVMPVYGRIGDLLGRRPVLLAAISLFIVGSVVGALAGDIGWLIAGRAIQGLGGGGLIILSQAAIADVVPARERGRYMGIMGAVFAVASVAGPLLGGWFTEGPGWRWAFWINLPLGAVAAVAIIAFLRIPRPDRTDRPTIDYLGAMLIAVATTAIVLVCTWGGAAYGWASPQILGLIAAAAVAGALFVLVENRAAQPIIPMGLFKDRDFTLSTLAGLLFGVAMFGAIGYLPTYLQMSAGVTATQAGMLMVPMMGGLLVASITTGQLVSRTGRYKRYPIAGAVVMAAGLGLISGAHTDTPLWMVCGCLALIGIGIGMGLQILVLIVQNAFPASIVGTATASTNYFRQVGASIGSAVVGSVFALRLVDQLSTRLPAGTGGVDTHSFTPAMVAHLPDVVRVEIVQAYNTALLPIFAYMVPLALAAAIAMCFVRERPLATSVERDMTAECLAEGQLIIEK